ncbi:MAG: class I SAM-dependent methyltransferase [Clostridiaceae bacterium]
MKVIPQFTKNLEKVSSFFPSLIHFYRMYYKKVVEREVELGNITKEDKVLCIGGGAFPSTAIELAEQTGAEVCVIDCDPEAVKCARRVVCKLRMNKKIKILQGMGQEIDPSDFSVIHMALQVFPRDKVLNTLLQRAERGCRILVRSPKDKLKSFYSAIPEDCNCHSCKHITQENSNMKATLLFTIERNKIKDEKVYAGDFRNINNRRSAVVG